MTLLCIYIYIYICIYGRLLGHETGLSQYNTHTENMQTHRLPQVSFKHMCPVFKQKNTLDTLYCMATVLSLFNTTVKHNKC